MGGGSGVLLVIFTYFFVRIAYTTLSTIFVVLWMYWLAGIWDCVFCDRARFCLLDGESVFGECPYVPVPFR